MLVETKNERYERRILPVVVYIRKEDMTEIRISAESLVEWIDRRLKPSEWIADPTSIAAENRIVDPDFECRYEIQPNRMKYSVMVPRCPVPLAKVQLQLWLRPKNSN